MKYRILLVLVVVVLSSAPSQRAWSQVCPQECAATWQTGTPYTFSQIVQLNGSHWFCNASPCAASVSPLDNPTPWIAVSGLPAWNTGVLYNAGDSVMRQGAQWTAIVPNIGQIPPSSPAFWRPHTGTPAPAIFAASSSVCSGGANNGLACSTNAGCPGGSCVRSYTNVEIQNAINAAPAGGIVQLDCATYSIATTITITKTIRLQGCTASGTFLTSNVDPNPVIAITGSGGSANYTSIRDLFIGNLGSTGTAIIITTADHVDISNVHIENQGNGISLVSSGYANITRSTFINGGFGISIDYTSKPDAGDGAIAENFFVGHTTANIRITNSGGWRIANNKLIQSSGTNLIVTTNTGPFSTGVYIANNSIENCLVSCVELSSSGGGSLTVPVLTGNEIGPCGGVNSSCAHAASADTIVVTGSTGSGVFTGNAIGVAPSRSGLSLGTGVDNMSISANQFFGTSAGVGTGITIATGATNTKVQANSYNTSLLTPYNLNSSVTLILDNSPVTEANLPVSAANGGQVFCSNCLLTGSMAMCTQWTGTGTQGAQAFRISGAWRCQ